MVCSRSMISKCLCLYVVVLFVLLKIIACRGYPSKNPPIHLNPNMDTQEKGKAYRESDFFDNGQYMRMPIEGTVARGQLFLDEHFYFGRVNNKPAKSFPHNLAVDENFLRRGQLVFNRVCAACHAHIGDGEGLVGKRLIVKPTSFHSEYMYGLSPGHFFDVISNGIRTMPGYSHMISQKDRWAIVTYIRSLQISQDANGEWIKRSAESWTQK
jgi:cytochrome c5